MSIIQYESVSNVNVTCMLYVYLFYLCYVTYDLNLNLNCL